MVELNGIKYYTSRELAAEVEVSKGFICRLAREGRLRNERTTLGYLFPETTAKEDWENRSKRDD